MKYIYSIKILLVFSIGLIAQKMAQAQDFHLVKDINTSTNSNPNNSSKTWAVLNGISYFSADDGINGYGLWRSDGTEAGTYIVKTGISPHEITATGGKLFFYTNSPSALYTSDGTEAGTRSLAIAAINDSSYIEYNSMFSFNGQLLFSVNEVNREALYISDGTVQGTRVLLNFFDTTKNTSKSIYGFNGLLAIKNKFYFSTDVYNKIDFSDGRRLWVTDGTGAGSYIIGNLTHDCKQLISNSEDVSDPKLYFLAAADNNENRLLYSINSQPGDAQLVAGFDGFGASVGSLNLEIKINNTLYFIGNISGSNADQSLYKYDLTGSSGVELVKEVSASNPDGTASYLSGLFNYNGTLVFSSYEAVSKTFQLWKIDSATSAAILLKDDLQAFDIITQNGSMYFSGQNALTGAELWRSDGTTAGTSLVKDIAPGAMSSNPYKLLALNNKLLFAASTETTGNELWQTNGTDAGTSVVKDINQTSTASSFINDLTQLNSNLIFSGPGEGGITGLNSARIFISDGTNEGTKIITDTIYHTGAFYDHVSGSGVTAMAGEAYFWGESKSGKRGLYKTDGTTTGTVLVKELGFIMRIERFFKTDDLIYFFVKYDNGVTAELWRTDGTAANTFSIKNDLSIFYLRDEFLAAANNNLFFSVPGQGLWKTDGSVAGTVLLKSFSDRAVNLFFNNNTLYFSFEFGSQNALWKSDGTVNGTGPVTSNVISAANFVVLNNEVFFTAFRNPAYYNSPGRQLFKTDGTYSGTVPFSQLYPGQQGIDYSNFKPIILNGILYFLSKPSSSANTDLWVNDPNFGTVLVTSLPTKDGYLNPVYTCNGKIFFVQAQQLWESDGTKYGIHTSYDITASKLSFSYPSLFSSVNSQLFFSGYSYNYREELYGGFVSPPAPYFTAIHDGNWSSGYVWANGMVPTSGANVIIQSSVTGNTDATCNTLHLEAGGSLTVEPGINISVTH